MKKDIYIYPAIFTYADDGIDVSFPDLQGCFTCAKTEEEAVCMAQEAVISYMLSVEEDNDIIPTPSMMKDIQPEKNQRIALISAIMPPARDDYHNEPVRKTLTLPRWLEALARKNHINFSSVLQEALKNKLCAGK